MRKEKGSAEIAAAALVVVLVHSEGVGKGGVKNCQHTPNPRREPKEIIRAE
jgi:hypothetical protein